MANLDLLMSGILWEDLPKTFQDAVHVCRRLGIAYLWIDMLCIIQTGDSGADWVRESARMASIYENAWLTIAADGAFGAEGGCFVSSHDRRTQIHIIECPAVSGKEQHVYAREQGFTFQNKDVAHSRHGATHGALDSRGWVYQERVLSPRTLLFTAAEMAWQCQKETRCECQFGSAALKIDSYPKGFSMADPRSRGSALHEEWRNVVSEFTTRDITFTSDRLPATSGMAAAFHRSTSATYAFGLWKEDFARDLLWYVEPDKISELGLETPHPSSRHSTFYAPSWSWASVTGPVRYDWFYTGHQPLVELLEITCIPATENQYGPAKSAVAVLRGRIAPVRLEARHNRWREPLRAGRGDIKERLHFKLTSVQNIADDGEPITAFFEPDVKASSSGMGGYEIDTQETHYLLLVSKHVFADMPVGLILRRARSAAETNTTDTSVDTGNTYERVGLMIHGAQPNLNVNGRPFKGDTWDQWLQITREEVVILV